MQNPENSLIVLQVSKETTRLYKNFLEIIEDIRNQCPVCISQERYEYIRKRVLDSGNDCQRELINFLGFFDFNINKEKVEEAAQQKKVVKKFITSSPLDVK